MNIEQFIYKFTGKSDWKDIEKLKFSVTEVMDIAEKFSSQLEPPVMPQDKIKEKIVNRLNRETYKQVEINGTPQFVYKPNHPIIKEIIEIIKDMDLSA